MKEAFWSFDHILISKDYNSPILHSHLAKHLIFSIKNKFECMVENNIYFCKGVIDVAVKYGYESPEAFSRAFKNLHGVIPMSARDTGVSLKAFPKMTFLISIKGVSEMNYRI